MSASEEEDDMDARACRGCVLGVGLIACWARVGVWMAAAKAWPSRT